MIKNYSYFVTSCLWTSRHLKGSKISSSCSKFFIQVANNVLELFSWYLQIFLSQIKHFNHMTTMFLQYGVILATYNSYEGMHTRWNRLIAFAYFGQTTIDIEVLTNHNVFYVGGNTCEQNPINHKFNMWQINNENHVKFIHS
jgi:hypothetical protein